MNHNLEIVQEFEEKLGVTERWNRECPQWSAAIEDIKKQKYGKALDALELLIVQRIFELTKMNRSEMGT